MTRSITIVGGGLAGLSLGIGLRQRGIPVELHEAGTYPRHRVCGEFISGVRRQTLQTLGIDFIPAASRPLRTATWFWRGRCLLREPLPEIAWGISRYHLDARLISQFAESGGGVHLQSRQSIGPPEGVVWSAGRIPVRGPWIGLKCHVRALPMDGDLEMHLGRGGYVGLARIAEDRINVCALFRTQRDVPGKGVERFANHLRAAGLPDLAERFAENWIGESFLGTAGFHLGRQPTETGRVALGDSAAIIPPFTGNGMSMAFESAETALEPLAAYARGELAWPEAARRIREDLDRRFARRMRLAGTLHPLLLHPKSQILLSAVAGMGLLPYKWLFRSLR